MNLCYSPRVIFFLLQMFAVIKLKEPGSCGVTCDWPLNGIRFGRRSAESTNSICIQNLHCYKEEVQIFT